MDLGEGLPRRVRWAAIGLGLALTLWSAFSYEGPYRWLAGLQLSLLGKYFVNVTFVFTALVCLVPALGVAQVARRFGLVGTASHDESQGGRSLAESANHLMAVGRGPLVFLVIGGVFVFLSGRDLWNARAGRTMVSVDVAELERGSAPSSTWVELRGEAMSDLAVSAEMRHVESTYVPIVSSGWNKGTPVGALLKVRASSDRGTPPYRGSVDPDGLPGMVRAAYEEAGIDASRAIVVQLGRDPGKAGEKAPLMLGIGLVVSAVSAVVLARRLRS